MTRDEKIRACVGAIVAGYDPYELMDQDATYEELEHETMRIIETNPAALLAWLAE